MVAVLVISEREKAQQGFARIPVPWGQEVKTQLVSDRKRKKFSWRGEPRLAIKVSAFADVGREADFGVSYRGIIASPIPRAKDKTQQLTSILKWAVSRSFREEVAARRLNSLVSSVHRPQLWADQVPPSLMAWAVAKGIKRTPVERTPPADPFKTRTRVVSLADRRQIAAALKRGEWCKVAYLDVLPASLREWLLERCSFIRWVGGGRVSGTPVNGYVTEDGLIFYMTEDGSTFYVQES